MTRAASAAVRSAGAGCVVAAFVFVAWNLAWAAALGVAGYVAAAVALGVACWVLPSLHARLLGERFAPWEVRGGGPRTGVAVLASGLLGAGVYLLFEAASRAEPGFGLGAAFEPLLRLRDAVVVPRTGAAPPAASASADVLTFVLFPAVAEEMLYRAYLQGFALRSAPVALRIGAAAVLFSVTHVRTGEVLSLVLMGVVLGSVFETAGALWPCVVVHAINNAVSLTSARARAAHPLGWTEAAIGALLAAGGFVLLARSRRAAPAAE
jgi:membrane protease YdiL (CAAX protease family)